LENCCVRKEKRGQKDWKTARGGREDLRRGRGGEIALKTVPEESRR
jgi:hypothetical protein